MISASISTPSTGPRDGADARRGISPTSELQGLAGAVCVKLIKASRIAVVPHAVALTLGINGSVICSDLRAMLIETAVLAAKAYTRG